MGNLSNLYISQSYQSLIHLATNNTASATSTELQDGSGNGIGIYVNTTGALSASSYSGSVTGIGNVSAFSTSVDSRIIAFQSSSVPAGTVSSSAQITALGFATTSSVTIVSASAWGAFQSASSYSASAYGVNVSQSQQIAAAFATSSANSASAYQVNVTQSFQITANALTASNATTALSQSLFFTDTTQSVNINNLTALTASIAYINVNNTFNGTQSFDNVIVTGTASVNFLNVIYQSSSVIYSSGSNILGDEANVDTQTLIGRNILTGSAEVTGSFKVNGVTTISSTNGTPLIVDHSDASPTQNTLIGFLSSGSAVWSIGNLGTDESFILYNPTTFQSPISVAQNNGVTFLGNITASGNISSSTISGIGNVTLYSASVDSRIVTNTTSITSLNSFSASITSSYNATSASLNSVSSSLLIVSGTVYTNTNTIIGLNAKTASYATTGSNSLTGSQIITGSLTITGSVATPPVALTISSNTASIDFSKGSIYTLTLVSSSVATYVTASNLIPGQTANLLVTQASALSGSLVWASAFKFPSGSSYTGSKVVNAVDLVSFITVNNSTIYSVGAKNLI